MPPTARRHSQEGGAAANKEAARSQQWHMEITRGPLPLSGYGPTARVPMVKSEADVSAPAEQPQMAVLMPQPLPLNEATSFVEWRHGAMGQLRLAGLWKAMVGEDTDPVRSERAYAWLLCNCKSHYLRLVVAAETAPAAWKALLADQQPDSYQLWEQLNSLQMQPGETVGQVHSRLLEIVWQLSAVKEQVSEPQQVMALLKAMPPLPQYENARDFITFGSLRSPLSLTEVKRTLQIAESRAQQAGVSAQLAAVRLRGKGGGGGGGGGGSSSSGGGSSRTQPAAVPAASSSSSTAPPRSRAAANVKCFKCGKRGHYARDCPDPARDGGMAGPGAGGEGGGASGGGAGGWAGAGKSSSGSAGLSSVTLAAVHASTLSHVAGTAPPLPACMPAEAGVGVGGADVHSSSAKGGSVVSCGDMTCCWSHAVGLSPMLPCVVDKHASLAPEPAAEPALLAVASTQQLDSSMRVWVADSGASHHITPERSLLHGYQGFAQPVPMGLGKSSVQLYAYGKGRVRLAVDGVQMELQDVLWAPEASTNYFSTLAAAQKGWEIRQSADSITMQSSKGEVVKGKVVGRQYQLSGSAQPAVVACEPPASAQAVTAVTPQLLHERLGHLSYRAMGDMISKGMVEGVELSAGQCRAAGSGVCPGCVAGKLHRRVADTLPSLAARVAAPCDLVHTDVCGPLRIPNAAGYCFVLTFLDEHSGLSLIALLKAKSEVPAAIRDAVEWFETQGGRKVKVLRSDRGTEYVNQAVREFLSGKGIIHQQTAPYSPQQNGSAERLNRTLFEKGRCLLYSSGLSVNFWPYALRFANYVRNLSLVRGKAGTPWELFWGVRPDLSALRVFGARAYAHVPEHMRSKLGSKAVQGVFVGYELSSKAYQVLLPGGKLLITKDVVFDELDRGLPTREADLAMLLPQPEPEPGVLVPHAVHVPVEVQLPAPPAAVPAPLERAPAPPGGATSSAEAGSSSSAGAGSGSSAGAGSGSSAGAGSSSSSSAGAGSNSSAGAGSNSSAGAGSSSSARAGSGAAGSGGGTEAVGRGSGAAGAAGGEGSGAANLLRQSSRLRGIQPEFAGVRSVAVAELPAEGPTIPATIEEALAGPQSEQWSLAADEEMQSLLSYGTWELVELPEGCRPLANRWVWSVKRDGRGSIVRFKARLVVKGFLQREGIDFHELHAPVSKHATVRALLAVAAAEDMELEHLDVKTAFLNGRLEEVIYMHQPAGYEDGSGRVCRLHRALYGLRQAPRAWHARLKEELEQLGFTASAADSCLFTMMQGSSKVLLAVYVDDCLLAVSKGDMGTLEWVKQQLAAVFDIHQLGPVEQFLGMRISRDRAARQLVLSQEQYAPGKRAKASRANGAQGQLQQQLHAATAQQQQILMSAAAATQAELEEARSQLLSCQDVNMRAATDLQVCQEQLHQSNEVLAMQVSLHRSEAESAAAKEELAACTSEVTSMGIQLAAMRAQLATAKRAMPKDVRDKMSWLQRNEIARELPPVTQILKTTGPRTGPSAQLRGPSPKWVKSTGPVRGVEPWYALSVVDRYGLADSRPRAVPLSTAEQLQREGVQQQSEGGHSFAEVIGSLQHLAVVSRPDIAHAVGVLAKFMSAPTKEHWRVLRGVLRYVADTAAMGLMYGASAGLVGFCDADFAGDTDTRRSTTGHVFMLHGGAVSWSSRRQPTVAASTTESEYMACSAAGKEGLWLRGVLADLSLGLAVVQPVTIMCDNEAALTLVKHPIASARSKHIDVLHHFVRERVARGELVFKFCGSAANVADVFTKALPSVKFEFCKTGMGMVKL
ncbi:hypothetical protein QJQ45_023697 [Haematococcus lacustris]|nr:hypothetical protein QJQ45_023697 [Haematococcus lacustris]